MGCAVEQFDEIVAQQLDIGIVDGPPVGVDSVSRDNSLPSRSTTEAPRMPVLHACAAASSPMRSSTVSAGPRTSIAWPPGRSPAWRSTTVTE
ncbi:hypothetical protein BZL29_2223 [Mycobacterium kansasii]|uniref:Uncharacterized protein n=1 Tax=Mycobacterium kansasii TaxID=1768 RepID=A0A1V3XN33_MYCKA|nr:hypothetical protein BZL29_2223 [Mycobacterium kansasii]